MVKPSELLAEVKSAEIVTAAARADDRGPVAKSFKIRARLKSIDVENLVITFDTQDYGIQGTRRIHETKLQVNERLSADLWRKGQQLWKLKNNISALKAYFINGFIVNGNANYHCGCESFGFGGFAYIATSKKSNFEDEAETRRPNKTNPRMKGLGCKHLVGVCQNMNTFKDAIVKMAQDAINKTKQSDGTKKAFVKIPTGSGWTVLDVDVDNFDPSKWTKDLASSDKNKKKIIINLRESMSVIMERQRQLDFGTIETDVFPTRLSNVKLKSAEAVASTGNKDGSSDDDPKIVSKINMSFSSPAKNLKPTQTEISIQKSVNIALGMMASGKIGGFLGAVVSSDNRIMDGHHRWAGTMLVDPTATVSGVKVGAPSKELVGILNVATKGIFKRDDGNEGKGNIKEFTGRNLEKKIRELLSSGTRIGKVADDGAYSESDIDGKQVGDLLTLIPGADGDLEKSIAVMMKHADDLPKDVPEWAPSRVDMPVIESDELGILVKHLESGTFDVVEPYSEETKQTSPK